MKISKFKAAAALGSLTATVALLAGMQGAMAQGAPGAGSFPGSILIPGTQTSARWGGFAVLDWVYDFSAAEGSNGTTGVSPGSAPLDGGKFGGVFLAPGAGHNIHGRSQFSADRSRLEFETRTPSVYGEVKTFIQADFAGPSGLTNSSSFRTNTNSAGLRLRLAYGTLGPLLAGQYFSVFRDASAEAETLDWDGDINAGPARVAQVRYTFDMGNGLTWAVSAEQAATTVQATAFNAGGTSFGTKQFDKIPDFVTNLQYTGPWGHVALHGSIADLYWHDGSTVSSSTVGWAVGLSGTYTGFWGKDSINGEVQGGQGSGRYINDDDSPTDAGIDAHGNIKPIGGWSFYASYNHWWTDTLRSTVTGGYYKRYSPTELFGACTPSAAATACWNQQDHSWETHVNLIWSPVPQVNLGIEWSRAQLTNNSGQQGNANRVQVQTQFKF